MVPIQVSGLWRNSVAHERPALANGKKYKMDSNSSEVTTISDKQPSRVASQALPKQQAASLPYYQRQSFSLSNLINMKRVLSCVLLCQTLAIVSAWKSSECPVDSQDSRDNFLCIRPCDYDDTEGTFPSRSQHAREQTTGKDNFFIVFFPPKGKEYEANRLKCPVGFKQVTENKQSCWCERPYTPFELEAQRRDKCDQAFESCRMYGVKPYDCNNIIDVCPPMMVRDYCLAGKVYKMRFASVVYQFCHAFLRLPNDGRRHFLEPDIDRLKH